MYYRITGNIASWTSIAQRPKSIVKLLQKTKYKENGLIGSSDALPPQLCAVHAMRHKSPGMFIR